MNSVLNLLNGFFTAFGEILLTPLGGSAWGLVLASAVVGVLLLWLYGRVSAQRSIKRIKRGIYSALLESILFRHNLATCMRAQGRMLCLSIGYLLLAVPVLVILALPCVIILAQLNYHFGYFALQPNGETVVKLALKDPAALYNLHAEPNAAVNISPPVRVDSENSIFWKLKRFRGDSFTLTIDSRAAQGGAGERFELPVAVGDRPAKIQANGYRGGPMALLYPMALTLPEVVQSYSISYPTAYYRFFGGSIHWVVVFFIASLASGLVASRYLHVEI